MIPSRFISPFSIAMLCTIMVLITLRIFLFGENPTTAPKKGNGRAQNFQTSDALPTQELLSPDYQDNMGAGILEKSPFSPAREQFVREVAPVRPQKQPRRAVVKPPLSQLKTGKLLGILGRGEFRRAIISIDGDPAPLEVKLGEDSPLGKLTRIERNKIMLQKNDKMIELSLF